jgi:hypothetical protein
MVDAAETVELVSVGAGVCGVLGSGGDGVVADGGNADDGAVRAGDEAMCSGDSGSLGGVGVSGGGEASALFGYDGGVEGGETDTVGGLVGGEGVGGGMSAPSPVAATAVPPGCCVLHGRSW